MKPLFITLTYPSSWPDDPKVWKRHLEALRKRLEYKYGRFPAVWKLEYQKRGAPHFHLIAFLDEKPLDLIPDVSTWWYKIVGSGDLKHLRAGTQVRAVKSWDDVGPYAAKYVAKLEKLAPGARSPGRFWGVWRRDLLNDWIQLVTVEITREDSIRIRRHLARYAGISLRSSRDLHDLEVYVPHSVSERLLRFYGYYP